MLRELLSSDSKLSAMRAMSLIVILTASFIGIVGLYRETDLSTLGVLCGVFLAAGFGGKVGQKFAEASVNDKNI